MSSGTTGMTMDRRDAETQRRGWQASCPTPRAKRINPMSSGKKRGRRRLPDRRTKRHPTGPRAAGRRGREAASLTRSDPCQCDARRFATTDPRCQISTGRAWVRQAGCPPWPELNNIRTTRGKSSPLLTASRHLPPVQGPARTPRIPTFGTVGNRRAAIVPGSR